MRVCLKLSVVASLFFIGCGGGSGGSSSSVATTPDSNNSLQEINGNIGGVYPLKPQEGTWSYLFYGEVNPKALGDIVNVRVIDSENPDGIILKSDDTTDIDDPSYIYNSRL